MDSGFLEQTGSSPSHMGATNMAQQQQFLTPHSNAGGSMQTYDFSGEFLFSKNPRTLTQLLLISHKHFSENEPIEQFFERV